MVIMEEKQSKQKRRTKRQLTASIHYNKGVKAFCIRVDGDEFWADTYERACCRLVEIVMRDEINYRIS